MALISCYSHQIRFAARIISSLVASNTLATGAQTPLQWSVPAESLTISAARCERKLGTMELVGVRRRAKHRGASKFNKLYWNGDRNNPQVTLCVLSAINDRFTFSFIRSARSVFFPLPSSQRLPWIPNNHIANIIHQKERKTLLVWVRNRIFLIKFLFSFISELASARRVRIFCRTTNASTLFLSRFFRCHLARCHRTRAPVHIWWIFITNSFVIIFAVEKHTHRHRSMCSMLVSTIYHVQSARYV